MTARSGFMSTLGRLVAFLAMALLALGAIGPLSAAKPGSGTAIVLKLDGAIGPASASYLADGLEQAREEGAALVIIAMDTPGGLDTSMREIIQEILAMPIPVVGYVHPSGARAASAGTYILYASHVAAMTPGTNLGAATPIQIGAVPGQPSEPDEAEEAKDENAAAPKNASERKAVNDAVAYIRSLAEMRGRNADWGEKAVREAASLSATSALEQNVIEIVAPDLDSLLEQLDGRSVEVMGQERRLSTADLAVSQLEPDWLDRLLATITNPNVALILMMIGVYGLFFEFWNPGSFVPGTIGAISLLVALYALAALPVDIAGVALILLGLALMVAEAFAPSFGILGLGGLAAFVFGAVIMFDTDVPQFRIDWSVIAAVALFSAGLLTAVARVGIRSHRGRVETGSEELIGARAEVIDWQDGSGHVFVHSERWNATGPPTLEKGTTVTVNSISGLQLEVSLPEENG
jgi:membrane-bound serine protease (ClpP class)